MSGATTAEIVARCGHAVGAQAADAVAATASRMADRYSAGTPAASGCQGKPGDDTMPALTPAQAHRNFSTCRLLVCRAPKSCTLGPRSGRNYHININKCNCIVARDSPQFPQVAELCNKYFRRVNLRRACQNCLLAGHRRVARAYTAV